MNDGGVGALDGWCCSGGIIATLNSTPITLVQPLPQRRQPSLRNLSLLEQRMQIIAEAVGWGCPFASPL